MIFEQFVMLAFCDVGQAWVKYENKLCCSSLAVAFYKGGRANGSKAREDAEIHMNEHECAAVPAWKQEAGEQHTAIF